MACEQLASARASVGMFELLGERLDHLRYVVAQCWLVCSRATASSCVTRCNHCS
jgi:hypothetical protein